MFASFSFLSLLTAFLRRRLKGARRVLVDNLYMFENRIAINVNLSGVRYYSSGH